MGIYSRDYVREPTGRGPGFCDEAPACRVLIIVTVAAFLLQFATTNRHGTMVNDWCALSPGPVLGGQVWRFVTYAFLHDQGSLLHLVFNMLGLWWFGAEMERLYGTREFACFYLVSAAIAGLGFVVWQLAIGEHAQVVGASGAVLATLTLFATHFPRHTIYFQGIIPLEIRWLLAIYVAIDLWPVLQALNGLRPASHVAHMAHLIGMLFAWVYRRRHWHLSGWLDLNLVRNLPRRWRQWRSRRQLQVYDPADVADLDGELDRILAKIHEHGSASLTEREQAVLTRASRQYKNRP